MNGRRATFFYAFVTYGNTPAYKTDVEGQIIDLGLKYGLVERKGAWYSYGDVRVSGMDSFSSELVKTGAIKQLEEDVYVEMEDE